MVFLSVALFISVVFVLLFYFYIIKKNHKNNKTIYDNIYYPFYDLIRKDEIDSFIKFIKSNNIPMYTTNK